MATLPVYCVYCNQLLYSAKNFHTFVVIKNYNPMMPRKIRKDKTELTRPIIRGSREF